MQLARRMEPRAPTPKKRLDTIRQLHDMDVWVEIVTLLIPGFNDGDDELKKLTLGGHDPVKVYNAYKAAVEHKGQPTVILARTIKGYGIGEAGEGKNITHQQKKLNEEELKAFRTRFGISIGDDEVAVHDDGVEPPHYGEWRRDEAGRGVREDRR